MVVACTDKVELPIPSLAIVVEELVICGCAAASRPTLRSTICRVTRRSAGCLGCGAIVVKLLTAEGTASGSRAVCVVALARRCTTPSRRPTWGAVVVGGVGDMWIGHAAARTWRWPGSLAIGDVAPLLTSVAKHASPPAVRRAALPGR